MRRLKASHRTMLNRAEPCPDVVNDGFVTSHRGAGAFGPTASAAPFNLRCDQGALASRLASMISIKRDSAATIRAELSPDGACLRNSFKCASARSVFPNAM